MPSCLTGFVCPTVSMVTTGHATGVEKTLFHDFTCITFIHSSEIMNIMREVGGQLG